MATYLLAHDLGTSGNKATLFSAEGKLICSRVSGYDTHYFNGNWAEQEPEDWWQAVCASTRQLLEQSGVKPEEIAAVSFSGHMMGCLCLDASGNPLRKHILWADKRAVAEADQLDARMAPERFYQITGHRNSASYGIQKLMWVKAHEPEIYEATRYMVNAKDWLVFRLTGRIMTEYSDAVGTAALDLKRRCWSDEVLAAAQIDGAKLPPLVASTHVAGGITPEAAMATGLAVGTPVVMGGGDGLCATVGAGCIREGGAYACIGSSAWISYSSREPLFDEKQRTFNWIHMVPDLYCPCGTMQTAGSAISWLKHELCTHEAALAEQGGANAYDLMDAQILQSPPGADGVLFLPYLLGERAPRWSNDAQGAFIGLKMQNTRADILRSVMEGVALNMGVIADVYRAYGMKMDQLNLIGGGARSDVLCGILADVWNTTLHRLNPLEEATAMGAAVAAGVGIGLYKDFSAVEQYISAEKTFVPHPDAVATYGPVKENFERCYAALEPVFPYLKGKQA